MRQATSPGGLFGEAPPPRPPTRGPVVIGVVLAVLAAALVAVLVVRSQGGGSTSAKIDPVATLAPTPPASVDPQQAVEAAVVRDYLAGWAAYDEATGLPDGKTPNPDLPALAAYTTGSNLTQVRLFITGMKGEGLTALGPPAQYKPHVVRVEGNTAVVQDCYSSDDHIVDAKTHALHDKPGPGKQGVETTMQLDTASGVWRASKAVTKAELCPTS